jgi:succinate-semialdehyde dehydrogenase/glutarate-semialdehyde dehydrogenase
MHEAWPLGSPDDPRARDHSYAHPPAKDAVTVTCLSIDPNTTAQPDTALATAYACLQQWKQTSHAQRAAIVHKAAALMLAHADDYARLVSREMRRRIGEARGEVRLSADILTHHARQAKAFLAPTHLYPRYGAAFLQGNPLGVLFCGEPWHFPFYQLARITGPQLMAGHTVIIQHAGYVPPCAIAFEKLWVDAGAPAGAYTNLVVSRGWSAQAHNGSRLPGVRLNGQLATNSSVAAHQGGGLKKSTMELGGSDAFIVLDDADLDRAIPWAVRGRMHQPGQNRAAAQRFIVVESVADAFLERFKAALQDLKIGGPRDANSTPGPMPTDAVLVRLLAQVDAALQAGAGQAPDSWRIARPGPFIRVAILTDILPSDPVFRDQFFGPVVSFHRVKDEAAAIALAHDGDAGLGGSVWTEDEARGKRVANAVEAELGFVHRRRHAADADADADADAESNPMKTEAPPRRKALDTARCWPLPGTVTLDAPTPRMPHVLD